MDATGDRMTAPQTRCFEASLECFPELREHVERYCGEAGIGRDISGRLVLVLEELFANTVEHGYSRLAPGAAARPVWLALAAGADGIEVVYEDAAPAHDPFAKAAVPDYSGPVDSWQVGGVGVALVIKLGRKVSYDRAAGRNRIGFTIPLRRSGV
jgi:anti-sigma regulatory factor (Ser/Thr protein kinase)